MNDRRAETIFALSSGALPAAIAIVRISGPAAGDVLATLAGAVPPPRRATLRALHDADGRLLDRALLLWFPGADSATGEDLAELHLHGGRAVVAAVLGSLAAFPGCRPAEAGEFTRRAFLHGRLDLAEAEGLADLLAAETEIGRRQALGLAEGGLSRMVDAWRLRLLGLSARAEAMLEFGDDGDDVLPDPGLVGDIAAFVEELALCLTLPPAERLRNGFRVVVAGPTNSGKSSLVNAIAGRQVAIATADAGTTRDLIEAPVQLDGIPIVLIDSAGLRDAKDAVERIGIELAWQAIASADLLLWLGDDARPRSEGCLHVHARADLPGRKVPPPDRDVTISVDDGTGLQELRHSIVAYLRTMLPGENMVLLNGRHRELIAACVAELTNIEEGMPPEIVAEHLRTAAAVVDRIVGRSGVEDMLDRLFGQFCIGK